MEIYGTKEANLDFNKVESSSKDENIKLALVHYSPLKTIKNGGQICCTYIWFK
jgi:hypothetical protein